MLISDSNEQFAIVGMQTDDTLILADEKRSTLEETELKNAGFRAKPKFKLASNAPLIFNGCMICQNIENLTLQQKEQGERLRKVQINAPEMQRQ